SIDEIANELRVSKIVPVEILEEDDTLVCILVNPADYVLGADRGGAVSMFDDFDIDYNQYKYLIETRLSGALVKLKAGMVVRRTASTNALATAEEPTFDGTTITIPTDADAVY